MIKPLLVTAAGRSGTTYLMRLLAAHPQIVAFDEYPLEVKVFLACLFPDNATCWNSAKPVLPSIASAHDLTLGAVQERYQTLAAQQGKNPLFFVEKHMPFLRLDKAPAVLDIKTIVLVRDPRDVLLSARAFDQKRGSRGFRERDGDSDEDVVLKYRQLYLEVLAAMDAKPDSPVVRYEELITSPGPTLRRVLDDVGLASDAAVISSAMSTVAPAGHHATAATPAESVGRWRREMPCSLQDLYRAHFSDIFEALGY